MEMQRDWLKCFFWSRLFTLFFFVMWSNWSKHLMCTPTWQPWQWVRLLFLPPRTNRLEHTTQSFSFLPGRRAGLWVQGAGKARSGVAWSSEATQFFNQGTHELESSTLWLHWCVFLIKNVCTKSHSIYNGEKAFLPELVEWSFTCHMVHHLV